MYEDLQGDNCKQDRKDPCSYGVYDLGEGGQGQQSINNHNRRKALGRKLSGQGDSEGAWISGDDTDIVLGAWETSSQRQRRKEEEARQGSP